MTAPFGQTELRRLIGQCNTRQPASDEAIGSAQKALRARLPNDYVSFLATSDGLEGFISENRFLQLWRASELAEFNAAYGDEERAPGLILIGSNGSDGGFGFDTREGNEGVVEVPFIDMSVDYYTPIARTFIGFLQKLASGYDYFQDARYPE